MVDAYAGSDALEHVVLFGLAIEGNDAADMLADHLLRGTEEALGRAVPRGDEPVQIFADDRVVGRATMAASSPELNASDIDESRKEPTRLYRAGHLPVTTRSGMHYGLREGVTAGSGASAGPASTAPSASNREPWHGHSQVSSTAFHRTSHPMWVQVADRRTIDPSRRRWAATRVPSRSRILPSPLHRSRGPSLGTSEPIANEVVGVVLVLDEVVPRRAQNLRAIGCKQPRPGIDAAVNAVPRHDRGERPEGHAIARIPGPHRLPGARSRR